MHSLTDTQATTLPSASVSPSATPAPVLSIVGKAKKPAAPSTKARAGKRDRSPGPKVYANKRGPGFVIRWRYVDPRTGERVEIQRKALASTMSGARLEARALEREVMDQLTADPSARAPAPTVDAFLEDFLGYLKAHNKSPATIRNYRQHWITYIAPVIGSVRLSDLTPAHFAEVLKECDRRGLAPLTKRQVIATINRGLSVAQHLDRVRNPPKCEQIRKPQMDVTALDPADARKLIDACETPRDQVLIALGLFGGLRRGEVCAVRGEDFEEGKGGAIVLTVRRSVWGNVVKSTKSGRERAVTFGSEASAAIRKHIATLDKPRAWLFPGQAERGDTCVESSAYVRAVKRISKAAGVAYDGTHKLRKTAATALAKAGLGGWQIAAFLGHAGIEIAQRYVDKARAQDPQAASAIARYYQGEGAEGSAAR